jgi:branched-chain amino acid transport system substrate-binding protein
MAAIREFEGITGTMSFTEGGDPNKCRVIATIDGGTPRFHKSVCP